MWYLFVDDHAMNSPNLLPSAGSPQPPSTNLFDRAARAGALDLPDPRVAEAELRQRLKTMQASLSCLDGAKQISQETLQLEFSV